MHLTLSLLPLFVFLTLLPGGEQPVPIAATYARVDGMDLKLDLYRPVGGSGPLPVLVWIHGGGWRSGSRRDCRPALLLQARHPRFAVASLDYRLTGVAPWPAQLEDCRAALRWLREHAGEHQLDGGRVAVLGSSAGGHLAAMLGTTGAESGCPVQVVVDWFGPADLATASDEPAMVRATRPGEPIHALLGGSPFERQDAARSASPALFADRADPAFLIIHGDADPVVPVTQSRTLHRALSSSGAVCELQIIPGGGHGGPAFTDPAVLDRAAAFVEAAFANQRPPAAVPAAAPADPVSVAAPAGLTRTGETWTWQDPAGAVSGILLLPPGLGPFPALVVSHGKGGNAAGFGRLIGRQAVGWGMAVIAAEYTHAGAGTPGQDGASPENLRRAETALTVVAGLPEVDRLRLAAFGHSMGGFVTIALAARASDRLRAVAITGSGLSAVEGFPAPTAAIASGIRVPVLMLHGEADRVVPPERSLLLVQVLERAATPHRRMLLPGAGHNLHQERPAEVAEAVRSWLGEHGVLANEGR